MLQVDVLLDSAELFCVTAMLKQEDNKKGLKGREKHEVIMQIHCIIESSTNNRG